MKRIAFVAVTLALIGYAALGIHTIVSKQTMLETQQVKLKSNTAELKAKQVQLDTVNRKLDDELHKNTDDVKTQQQLQQQVKDLQDQLQAKIDAKNAEAAKVAAASRALTGTAVADAATVDTGSAKMWIYMHESGNNPSAQAGNGACGLGQALPCSKMPCQLGDYACQDQFFTSYMTSRYGTWENAKASWIARASYYNGDYHGGWW